MINVHEVSLMRGETLVLNDVSITLPRPGLTSIIGPNGAGKSTLLAVIARLLQADGGTVSINGMDTRTTDTRALARVLSVLRQDNTTPARLTVKELVCFGRFPHTRRLQESDRAIVDDALGTVGMNEYASRHIDELSGGQRQRAFLAMILAQSTDYVLLDEPLNNLDMRYVVQIMGLVRDLAHRQGKSVVLVIHDINVAAAYSDNMIAMKNGTIHCAGTVEDIMQEPVLEPLYDMPLRLAQVDGRPTVLYY